MHLDFAINIVSTQAKANNAQNENIVLSGLIGMNVNDQLDLAKSLSLFDACTRCRFQSRQAHVVPRAFLASLNHQVISV